MAQGVDSTKTPARPSHEAIESGGEESMDRKMDKVGMESAKRAQNRIHDNEERTPGNTIFSK